MARRKVYLHGKLGDEFGELFEFEVTTAGEAIRALNANFPNRFMGVLKDGSYYLIRGDEETGMGLEEDHLNSFNLGNGDLHIIPAVKGSAGRGGKGGGGVKAILGVALIGTAIFMSGGTMAAPLSGMASTFAIGGMNISWGTVAAFGLAMTVAGAAQLLSPKEKPKDETKREDSFAFSGPINTNEQGNPIPLVYGRVMTGGQIVSSGIDIEDIGTYAGSTGSGVPGHGQAYIGGNLTSVFSGTWNTVDA
ncbi:MAG TPA: hypothetical protein VGO06_06250 [Bosea sp. (in: a-proteobacteria)]|jgi:predicted phage tail protein|uniref:hypothetical protein n=1 Tax=Bosea sp. (in: a-proteobacteria) TaxID=1871050 RepID=UPI002E118CD1|nr:hypothetical protein [Bosea sp. (in: a-proteobacteria)]